MKAETVAAAVCGVWIEFLDAHGHTLEQHVVDEWHGRPVPARGDSFHMADVIGIRRFQGVVVGREADLQHTSEGEPRLWVRLTVRVTEVAARRTLPEFSFN
jgi:hypothetical protein